MMKNHTLFRIIAFVVLISSCAGPPTLTGKEEGPGGPKTTQSMSAQEASEYIDQQERELQQLFAVQKNPTVQRSGNTLIVTLGTDLLFGVDSNVFTSGAYDHLGRLAVLLKKYPRTRVSVNSYTDSTGSEAYNLELSEKRAIAVKHVLVNDGIQASRVATGGFGETQFVSSNATEAGRQRNRRICVVIAPDGE